MDSLGCLPVSSLELMRQLAIMLYPTLHIPGLYCTIKHPPIWPIKNKKKQQCCELAKTWIKVYSYTVLVGVYIETDTLKTQFDLIQ